MSEIPKHEAGHSHGELIHMPAGTAWPIVLAFGCTMLVGGLLLGLGITILGAVLCVTACIGWFREVLPHEHAEYLPVKVQPVVIETRRKSVERINLPSPVESERGAPLPVSTYPVISGIKGGAAGGLFMIIPALIYGLIVQHSIWYPINLLGGAGVANWQNPTTADIAAFHWEGLAVATVIQIVTSLLVGLLYGAMLPMLPSRPILLGGVLAPLLWTGLLHSTLGLINPVLDDHISWPWFFASQITFGLVAGWVVSRDNKHRTAANLPFALRIGLEAPGLMHDRDDEEKH